MTVCIVRHNYILQFFSAVCLVIERAFVP